MTLPADSHVHTEWSWDAPIGSMGATCARAIEIGLPAVAFTEHVDHTEWLIRAEDLAEIEHLQQFATPEGSIAPTPFDAEGYLACVQECRDRFPTLKIITGMEVGEPHWHAESVQRLLAVGNFERVLGSLHNLPLGTKFSEPPYLFTQVDAAEVVRRYLAEIPNLVKGSDVFSVLAHIDYPTRYWPIEQGAFDIQRFEDEFRYALSVTAGSGRALELNTGTLRGELPRWWREEGGKVLTFGSDAHDPTRLAHRFNEATTMAEAAGFKPGRHPWDFWYC